MWWWTEFISYGETLVVAVSRKAMRLPELIKGHRRTPHSVNGSHSGSVILTHRLLHLVIPLTRVARISYRPVPPNLYIPSTTQRTISTAHCILYNPPVLVSLAFEGQQLPSHA